MGVGFELEVEGEVERVESESKSTVLAAVVVPALGSVRVLPMAVT